MCREKGQMRKKSFTITFNRCIHAAFLFFILEFCILMWDRKLVNVTFLFCPSAESQQQNRRGAALVLVHTIALELIQREVMHACGGEEEGEKQKGTETSLTHSFTK